MACEALAIIPARGGSKRLPRKNVRAFAGRPMIGYAIKAAAAAGVFARIVVSTDDEEIAAVARSLGAELPFTRPASLADDFTPTVPVIAHAVDAMALPADAAVCCIYPAVPLLDAGDLRQGLELLELQGPEARDYVFPVAAYPSPVQRALVREADGRTRPLHPQFAATRTQDLEPAYFDAGQFYWARAATWRAGGAIHARARTFVVPEWRVVDIDTAADWQRAETLYRSKALP